MDTTNHQKNWDLMTRDVLENVVKLKFFYFLHISFYYFHMLIEDNMQNVKYDLVNFDMSVFFL